MLNTLFVCLRPVLWNYPYRGTWSMITREFLYDLRCVKENTHMEIVWHMPWWVIYWAVIRGSVYLEPQSYPGDVKAKDILKAINKKQGVYKHDSGC